VIFTTLLKPIFCGAKNGIRTRDLNLGKVALYQLSYFRIIWRAKIIIYFITSQKKMIYFLFEQNPIKTAYCEPWVVNFSGSDSQLKKIKSRIVIPTIDLNLCHKI
jgi:hypothetical protein